jgi:hypothetical protein
MEATEGTEFTEKTSRGEIDGTGQFRLVVLSTEYLRVLTEYGECKHHTST